MRALTSQEEKVLQTASYSVHVRVSVKSAAGAWHELTNLYGQDYVQSVEYSYNIDDQAPSAVITLRRDIVGAWSSLAPLMGGSRLNSGGALLRPKAEVLVETATLPRDIAPQSSDWREVHRGLIDAVDSAGQDISVSCRDKIAAELQRQWVTAEKLYSDGTGIISETLMQSYIDDWYCGLPRQASTAYLVGDRIQASPSGVYGYRCTTAGTTAAGGGPAFPTTPGATVADGTATWTCIGPTILLRTPSASSWAVKGPFKLEKQPLMEALRQISDQNGWALRVLWHDASNAFRLTYLEPDRAATVPAWTFGPDDYLDVTQLDQDGADVRNFVRVVYSDTADLDAAGNPKRKTVQVLDLASIDAFEEQFLEVSEASSSQINTSAQATTYANAILADLKDLKATLAVECPYAYHLELGDLIGFNPDSIHFDTAQKLAVVGIRHTLSRDRYRTAVVCRGTPAAQYNVWLERAAGPGQSAPAPFQGPDAPINVTVLPIPNGLAITWSPSPTGVPASSYDVHVSTTSGFTPSSANLKGTTAGLRLEVADNLSIVPGTTYYVKVIPRDAAGNAGATSAQVSTAAGYVTSRGLQPRVINNVFPMNSSFETYTDPTLPPDTWDMAIGTWGVDATVSTSTVYGGGNSLRILPTSATTLLRSQPFAITPNLMLSLRATLRFANITAPADGVLIYVEYLSDLTTVVQQGPAILVDSNPTTGVWFDKYTVGAAPPVTARYARVGIQKLGTNLFEFFVDGIAVERATIVQEEVHTVTLGQMQNSWVFQAGEGPEYWMDSAGIVHLSGRISNGTHGNTAFTLPVRYWPARSSRTTAAIDDGAIGTSGTILVDALGHVIPYPATGSIIHLDGVTIETRAYNANV